MLDKLRAFLFEAEDETEPTHDFSDLQLAEAALLFHVIAADGVIQDSERQKMHQILSEDYQMSSSQVDQLIEEAHRADNETVDLYRFTSILKHQLNEEERMAIVRRLWQIVFADGEIHELEDNVVWRIAELLAIDNRKRMELKREARNSS